MTTALLLVDLQHDFLSRPGLDPVPAAVVRAAAELLEGFRSAGQPVFHAHTIVGSDGEDRMPHWKREGVWECVEDTPGAQSPESVTPRPGEMVVRKRFFSAFESGVLAAALHELGVRRLVVAGVLVEGCVRATVLDAYARGLDVVIAEDAVGSADPAHGALTRRYLELRAGTFLGTAEALARFTRQDGPAAPPRATEPVGFIAGACVAVTEHPIVEKRSPSRWGEVLAQVPLARSEDMGAAAVAAARAQTDWRRAPPAEREARLSAWGARIAAREEDLAALLAAEIGKPVGDAREEIARACRHLDAAVGLLAGDASVVLDAGASARDRPVGVIGIVTPWNNPVAIAVGKIAPALALGNTVVWKPSPEAPLASRAVAETLHEAGLTRGEVAMLHGDAATVRALIDCEAVDAVSLTGSVATGRAAAALCARSGKPLQAELGGNNAAIVLRDFDLAAHALDLAREAFRFAGQRCTATSRFVVEEEIAEDFEQALVAAVGQLRIGDPRRPETDVGPLVSRRRVACVQAAIDDAVAHGARVLCGGGAPGRPPDGLIDGCWLSPTVLADAAPGGAAVMRETFGPFAVVQRARGLEHALYLANAVPHGLVAALYTSDAAAVRRFTDVARAGILKLAPGPLGVHADAPFGGWKASGIGAPEHGRWDRITYSRPQAVYGTEAP